MNWNITFKSKNKLWQIGYDTFTAPKSSFNIFNISLVERAHQTARANAASIHKLVKNASQITEANAI